MLGLIEVGRRLGLRRRRKSPNHADIGLGPIDAAVFGLLGLLMAFTFSGAGARFDSRRQLIGREANAVGTAYLRLNLLPEKAQPRLRESLRRYLDARLAFYRELSKGADEPTQEENQATTLQSDIWNQAVAATRQTDRAVDANAVTLLVMQSLNDMIDITTTRSVAMQTHPPLVIYGMLLVLVLVCSVLVGYETAANPKRYWVHTMGFVVIITVTVMMIFDYEYPRYGLIRIDPLDQVLVDLRKSMK
jgi:hypothetical protein